ncbi:3f7a26af-ae52-418b-b2e1-fe70533629b0 [Thermothielavioides terrestris]|jgi:hypothetical protein|uniref:DUF7598 domain-containing protein n=2 Tax=Thermothielavioides terrestris TaxID=2587410 RepID=G2RFU1_THETT|nr:uncharacterized protein THITE_2124430 [Thermothielavioides terrestris NRRL 8126]AEO71695.1 hypothetical protein THITE_2124430 [Thermothielavioides terrestris NRRL 8126]SPQ27321.1 3f7a26af-ae52-418b-b2e1-fe70533629b0 [Thermothielavioides terrestris]
MFSLGQDSKLLGIGHVVLNVLRALNLIGLAAVMLASMAMPVLSGFTGNFFFFDTLTHVFVFLISAVLFYSELPIPWFKAAFRRTWPVLGPDHSLAWLGFGMIFIGFQVLGDLIKPAYTTDSIGWAWWRAFLASGILAITFGFFNIFGAMVFRASVIEKGVRIKATSRMIRTHGKLALQQASDNAFNASHSFSEPYSPPHRDNWSAQSWSKEAEVEPSSAVKRLTRVLNPKNFRKSRPYISKPFPQNLDNLDVEQGHEDRASPILPTVQRPPTAMHPALTGSSHYSAAHMDPF